MTKNYLIIYENNDGDIFKKVYRSPSKKEAIEYFKEHNTKYGYKVIAIKTLTSKSFQKYLQS